MDLFGSGAYGIVTSDRLGYRQRLVQLAMLAEDAMAYPGVFATAEDFPTSGLIRPCLGSR